MEHELPALALRVGFLCGAHAVIELVLPGAALRLPEASAFHTASTANDLVSSAALTWITITGAGLYFNPAPETVADRLYGDGGEDYYSFYISMAAAELYGMIMSLRVPILRKPEMLVHHGMTCALCLTGLRSFGGPFLHYHGTFFMGTAQVTSVLLGLASVAKGLHPRWEGRSKIAFGLSFIFVRCLWWPVESYGFWQDLIGLMRSGKQHSTLCVVLFAVANVFLTSLQFLWGRKIATTALSLLSGSKRSQCH